MLYLTDHNKIYNVIVWVILRVPKASSMVVEQNHISYFKIRFGSTNKLS